MAKLFCIKYVLVIGLLGLLVGGCSTSMPGAAVPVAESGFQSAKPALVNIPLGTTFDFDDGLDSLPLLNVNVSFLKPVPLGVVLLALQGQGVNLVASFGSGVGAGADLNQDKKVVSSDDSAGGETETFGGPLVTLPYYRGPLVPLLRQLREITGYYFDARGGILSVYPSRLFAVDLPQGVDAEQVQAVVSGFGITGGAFDRVAGALVFSADWLQAQALRSWIVEYGGLDMVEFEVVLLESEVTAEKVAGFDWSQLGLTIKNVDGVGDSLSVAGSDDGVFSLAGQAGPVSLSAVVRSLVGSGWFHVLQSGRLALLSGQAGTLDVSRKIPYVEEVTVSDDDDGDPVQGVTFAEVDSGIVLDFAPVVRGDFVVSQIVAKLQSVVSFLEVGPVDLGLKRPVVTARNFSTWAMLVPGEIAVVGGLRYARQDGQEQRLSDLVGGWQSRESQEFEVVALVRPRLIRYSMEVGG